MRKLIEISQEHGIQCDNKSCDFVVNGEISINETKKWLNVPCPKCGHNLLTERDFNDFRNMIWIINIVNFLFSWVTIFIPKKYYKEMLINTHNGVKILENEK